MPFLQGARRVPRRSGLDRSIEPEEGVVVPTLAPCTTRRISPNPMKLASMTCCGAYREFFRYCQIPMSLQCCGLSPRSSWTFALLHLSLAQSSCSRTKVIKQLYSSIHKHQNPSLPPLQNPFDSWSFDQSFAHSPPSYEYSRRRSSQGPRLLKRWTDDQQSAHIQGAISLQQQPARSLPPESVNAQT
jgi:hypothetical protein